MYKYAIMQDPGHNRVYYKESQKLSFAELKLACQKFKNECYNIQTITIAEIRYFSFEMDNKVNEKELFILSRLSFIFAIFEVIISDENSYLIPIAKTKYEYIDPKISSILKYSGKTNELFTKMMINVALLSSSFNYEDKIKLLDPISGKGTTLYEGCVYGFDVFGIEIVEKYVHESCVFFKKYLEREKYKHKKVKRKIYQEDASNISYINEFEYARTKDEYKDSASIKKFSVVGGNSIYCNRYFKKNSFHIIVGDLPYGVAHGNIGNIKQKGLTRNPSELLTFCLPEWYKVLKKGGVLVIAWNKFVMPKDNMIKILKDNGLEVLNESLYNEFEHKVDMSIKRDIIVAKKMN